MRAMRWLACAASLAMASTAGAAVTADPTTTGWACASVVGYGLDLDTPYGYQNCNTATGVASVDAGPFHAAIDRDNPAAYPALYSGSASVSLDGVLRAKASARWADFYRGEPYRWGVAEATMVGYVQLGDGRSHADVSKTLALDFDGSMKSGSYSVGLYVVRLNDGQVFQQYATGNTYELADGTLDVADQISLAIDGHDGDRFSVWLDLAAMASLADCFDLDCGGAADFSHTAKLSFAAGGADLYGLNGFFAGTTGVAGTINTSTAVPEPALPALLSAALGAALVVRRQRCVQGDLGVEVAP